MPVLLWGTFVIGARTGTTKMVTSLNLIVKLATNVGYINYSNYLSSMMVMDLWSPYTCM